MKIICGRMLIQNCFNYHLGFVPRLNAHFGQRYTVSATEALSEFQKVQLNQRAARNQLERVVDLQAGKGQPWDLVDRFVSDMDIIIEEPVNLQEENARRLKQ